MKEVYGDKVRFAVHGPRRGLRRRFGAELAANLTAGALGMAEERALWARFGL